MNYKAIGAAFLLVITLCAFKCNKTSEHIGGTLYTAIVKSSSSCARYYACIITEGYIDPELVDNNWESGNRIYQKAFMVRNNCDFPSGIREGESFRFRIVKKPVKNDCIICNIAITGTPSKSLNIEVVP
ncbi:hypothetical protein [Niabella hibiscisoli]|uniref:hypothetical protein n=1 Tax=Niabella hibiscisoli TaxID=1825928 RepID=UPI001F0FE4BA|nr:hypothetical protein [Niabella hibiscisoli]MCH5717373.1 hypothetical protein [Niabella hibiscisoli]